MTQNAGLPIPLARFSLTQRGKREHAGTAFRSNTLETPRKNSAALMSAQSVFVFYRKLSLMVGQGSFVISCHNGSTRDSLARTLSYDVFLLQTRS